MPRSVPRTYPELLRRVKATLFAGQRAADIAWVQTFHETGRLIHSHVLLEKRADYGAKIIHQLARDTGTNERRLYECRQFYRAFPILRISAELGWSRGLLLSQVADPAERETLMAEVLKDNLPSDLLKARVRALNAADKESDSLDNPASELLRLRCGTVGLRRIVDRGYGPVIDLGFMNYHSLTADQARRLAVGDIVRFDPSTEFRAGYGVRKIDGATTADLFTYTATVRKVIDGDTLDIALEIAPGDWRELKLRLRGLDCPEVSTAAGRAAKAFVDGLLKPGDEIVVCTTKPDKYDRYLADVFVGQRDKGPVTSDEKTTELFLNNALLEGGYAVRYDGGAKEGM